MFLRGYLVCGSPVYPAGYAIMCVPYTPSQGPQVFIIAGYMIAVLPASCPCLLYLLNYRLLQYLIIHAWMSKSTSPRAGAGPRGASDWGTRDSRWGLYKEGVKSHRIQVWNGRKAFSPNLWHVPASGPQIKLAVRA